MPAAAEFGLACRRASGAAVDGKHFENSSERQNVNEQRHKGG
jgi:hypothetical protein